MDEPEGWLVGWFARKRSVAPAHVAGEVDYFEAGWIDSLGIVELVADIEDHFGLRFDERHFQDRRFATVSGLASIVREIRDPRRSDPA